MLSVRPTLDSPKPRHLVPRMHGAPRLLRYLCLYWCKELDCYNSTFTRLTQPCSQNEEDVPPADCPGRKLDTPPDSNMRMARDHGDSAVVDRRHVALVQRREGSRTRNADQPGRCGGHAL